MLSFAAILFAPIFADHAVLQQGKPVPIWGKAAPGEKVVVTFGGQKVSALTDSRGDWVAYLDALSAATSGADLTAGSAVLHDVVVGEVWLAAGQSNMEFVVDDPRGKIYHVDNAAQEVAAAQYPLIRHFKVAHQVAKTPVDSASGSWQICSPATVPEFSAVAYFYARELFRKLRVPIGIINCSWGGTPVEAWMSPLALAQTPLPHAHPSPGHPRDNWTITGLYNGMVNPVVPYALRGAIWYQGESNADLAADYHPLFAGLISAWRAHFGQGDIPFYWVQLANYANKTDPSGTSYAELRAQQNAALSLPATGQAVTIDIGDPDNIHPHNKQEVGRRLALIAKTQAYDIPGDYSGPLFQRAVAERDGLRVYFRYADNGLTAAGKPAQSFEVAGPDRRFWPATASLSGASAWVRSPNVHHPVWVRYAWRNAPEANLYNGAGLPAVPFSARAQN
jgi:sialate O-acetylesterase